MIEIITTSATAHFWSACNHPQSYQKIQYCPVQIYQLSYRSLLDTENFSNDLWQQSFVRSFLIRNDPICDPNWL
jgi:hypothetical protein